jgi:hypothetical protein
MARTKKKKNLNDIVDKLVDKAYDILEWQIIEATSVMIGIETEDDVPDGLPKGYMNFNHKKLQEIVDMIKPLFKANQQTRKIEAKTSNDIVQLVVKGKISLEEAVNLMTLVKLKNETEEKEISLKIRKELMESLSGSNRNE